MSILKSDIDHPESCNRYTFAYSEPKAGTARYIHTYMGDGSPLPSYEGEPTPVEISGSIDEFTDTVWGALNEDNKVSLSSAISISRQAYTKTRIVNKNI